MIMKKTQLFLIKFFGLQNIDNNRWPWTKMTFYSTHFPSSHQRRSLESRRRSFLNCPSSQTKYVSNYGIFFFQCSPFISSANPLTTLIPQHPIAPVLWLNQTNSKWCYFSSISTSTCTGVDDNHFVNMENCFPRGARMPSCCEISHKPVDSPLHEKWKENNSRTIDYCICSTQTQRGLDVDEGHESKHL